ncbi:AEC family transporter [[Clostridium] polysaccharolyticum]|uniref:AEC family transporter n=1 Tax=[Clostridium] polysaccharolyticum TaxID=29364 RepID=A0A1I0CZB6_9FIRM|nr:AEC family transporter [[Clostridium] polysaccharolyticum]SET24972.1 hypothetical protein SAMN04487772_11225 [[Clostridium] polysaccharolyticum]
METFVFACNAVLPIILLIFLGYYLRRKEILNDSFLKCGNRFVFQVALPVLLFYNVYSIEAITEIHWQVLLFICMAIGIIFLAGIGVTILFTKEPKKRGVLLQCIFRSNFAIIGIPLAESIGGSGGIKAASVVSAFSIPMFNVLAVVALTMFQTDASGKRVSLKEIGKKIAKNPLIRGVLLGIICLLVRLVLPREEQSGHLVFTMQDNLPFLYKAIKSVGTIASPLALIVLGGNFQFRAVKRLRKEIIYGTFWRVVLTPFLALTSAVLLSSYTERFQFTNAQYSAFIALFASPVAVASAIMAGEMGGDEELAGQLVVWTSIMSVFTIFIAIVILRGIGLV